MGCLRFHYKGKVRVSDPISTDGWVVGRGEEADFVIRNGTVSREHARLFRRSGSDWIVDLGSTNGTAVNGQRVGSAPLKLEPGDRIQVGHMTLSYESGSSSLVDSSPSLSRSSIFSAPTVTESASVPPSSSLEEWDEEAYAMVDEVSSPPTLQLLGGTRWRDLALIGRGGMGEVFRAYDVDLATTVAIKKLRSQAQESIVSMLEKLHAREASIASMIRHPNVVQVLEDGVYQGDPYMILEWVQGKTLSSLLSQDRLTRGAVVEVLRQVSLALRAAHDMGVVHADLKPSNVLVVDEETNPDERSNLDILEDPDESKLAADAGVVTELGSSPDPGLSEEISRRLGVPSVPSFDSVPFVGRESELALLEGFSEERRQAEERLFWILLFGERGVGKRRLAFEFVSKLRQRGDPCDVVIEEDGRPPTRGAYGLWISILPPSPPDDSDWQRDYSEYQQRGCLREIFVKPFLRGQMIKLVESIVKDSSSARTFVKAVESETGGNVRKLLGALETSFEDESWSVVATGYRLNQRRFFPEEIKQAQLLERQFAEEEKGLRDLLTRLASLGRQLNFEIVSNVSGLPKDSVYYLLDYAVSHGYLKREPGKLLSFKNEHFRTSLQDQLSESEITQLTKKALPQFQEIASSSWVGPAMYFQIGQLEHRLGRVEAAMVSFFRAALRARQTYESTTFAAACEELRELYRDPKGKKGAKAIRALLEDSLGDIEVTLSFLNRLRLLPTRVKARLSDFGIARKLSGEEGDVDDSQPWGTPRYMSPEQIRREPLTPASDIYSLGIVFREALEGEHPLHALRGRAAMVAILDGAVQKPNLKKYPQALVEVIQRMLDPDPKSRPSASEVAEAVQRAQLSNELSGSYD